MKQIGIELLKIIQDFTTVRTDPDHTSEHVRDIASRLEASANKLWAKANDMDHAESLCGTKDCPGAMFCPKCM